MRCNLGESSEEISEAIVFADLGDIALRSTYVSDGVRWALAVADVDLHASTTRRALATASRGGTMLNMISVFTTKSSYVGKSVIWVDLIRSKVSRLVSISYSPQAQ